MKRVYILPFAALVGIVGAVLAVLHDNEPPSANAAAASPLQAPYASYVAGAGIVEASTGNIAVGTPVSGIVAEMYVKVGEHVKPGNPLFKIDDRDLQARLVTARARVDQAAAALLKPTHRLEFARDLEKRDRNAVRAQDLSDLHDEVAGARSSLELAKAELAQVQTQIDMHTVRAPVAGNVLRSNIHVGEFVEGSSGSAPLMLLGDNDRMYLRVDVDEHDAWRVRPGCKAMAFQRGHPGMKIPLQYEYVEPYMVPKTSLTGLGTERSDTRVLQVIFGFERGTLPVYIGQQLDVYIQAADKSGQRDP